MSDLEAGQASLAPVAEEGHADGMNAVAAGERQGRPVVVSGGHDGTVRVWDLEVGEPRVWNLDASRPAMASLAGHDSGVTALAVGERQGQPVVVSGGGDGVVRVWDIETARAGAGGFWASPAR